MNPNCRIKIFTLEAKVITLFSIFYEACSKKELFYSEKISAFNQLFKVRRMTIFPVILALEPIVRQISSDIEKTCMREPEFRLLLNILVSLSLLLGLLLGLLLTKLRLLRFH